MTEPNADTLALIEALKRERAARIAAEETARRAEETARRAEETARRAEEARLEAEETVRLERAARIAADQHAREDAANFREALRREKEEREQEQQGQTLHEYLAQAFQYSLHLPRLLTSPLPAKNPKTKKTQTPNFTTGRTDIGGKHYPLRLCQWPEFQQLHEEAWARIEARIGEQRQFPSLNEGKAVEQQILDDLPTQFLKSAYFLNEARTSAFLHNTLQKPASKIFNAYLAASGTTKMAFFNNRDPGVQPRSPSSSGNDAPTPSGKTRPDCLVLRSREGMDAERDVGDVDESNDDDGHNDGDNDPTSPPFSRFVIGEHKAARRLRAAVVSRIIQGPMPEDYIDQLADKRIGTLDSGDSTTADGSASVLPVATGSNSVPPNQVYLAYALCQAYHYLLMAGLEFGYLASGETLTFLRIPENDCTTLLYHVSLFPEHATTSPSSPAIDPKTADDAVFRRLAITQLCSLCLLADEAGDRPRSLGWRVQAHRTAPTFPRPGKGNSAVSQPPSIVSDQASTSSSDASSRSDASSLGKRKRRDDDDDDDDDNNGHGSGTRGRLAVRSHQARVPSPLQHHESSVPDDEQSEQGGGASGGSKTAAHMLAVPSRPSDAVASQRKFRYCTHACLLGVARGHKLDYNCPNVLFHKSAVTNYNLKLSPELDDVHPIPRGQFSELVRLQLSGDLERDCTCFVDIYSGNIGCLFKITLTGFGYTFVAKGVESHNYKRLVHETSIYRELSDFQGGLIPVHLGLIKLAVEYPMVDFTVVTHMMLLSYAGMSIFSDRFQRRAERLGLDADWEAEAERTARELEAAGLVDEDDNMTNMMWCESTQRAMRIDFDHAYMARG